MKTRIYVTPAVKGLNQQCSTSLIPLCVKLILRYQSWWYCITVSFDSCPLRNKTSTVFYFVTMLLETSSRTFCSNYRYRRRENMPAKSIYCGCHFMFSYHVYGHISQFIVKGMSHHAARFILQIG